MSEIIDRLVRRYLSRRVCWLCEQRLDRINKPGDCCAIDHRCAQETIDKRRASCLAGYRPRRVMGRR